MADLTKVLRPFDGLDGFDHLLELVTVSFGQEELSPGTSVTVDDALDYLSRPIDIDVPFGAEGGAIDEQLVTALADASLEAGDVEFLVVSTTGGLRRSDIIERINLENGPVPSTISIGDKSRWPSLRAPTHGVDIEVMLLLARELKPGFAKPHRKGTWLGRSKFTLLTKQPARGFQVLPLTDAVREEYELGPGVHWFIMIPDHVDIAAEGQDLGDILNIYVAIDVLNRLKLVPNTPDGVLIQSQIVLDGYRAVVTRILQGNPDPASPMDMPPRNSPFFQLLEIRSGATKPTEEDLEASLDRFTKNPEGFVADLANRDDLKEVVYKALENPE